MKYFLLLIFFLKINISLFSQCSHPDYEGLMELYNATGGENWTNNSGWKEGAEGKDCDPCKWYGVKCLWGDRVLILELKNNNLIGFLPDLKLSELGSLSINENLIQGNIPNFKNLPKLSGFNCQNNKIIGTIPNFDHVPALIYLYCNDNILSGEIPNFSYTPDLTWILCYNNQLTGLIPKFDNIPKLEYLRCYNNQLTGTIPDFNLSKLKEFHCSNNKLVGQIPSFSTLSNLELFYCYYNNLTGQLPDFSHLPRLKQFFCSNNNISGCLPDFICQNGFYFWGKFNPLLPWQGDHTQFCTGASQVGAPCDDNDPNTQNDIIKEDCTCGGSILNKNENDLVLDGLIQIYPNPSNGVFNISMEKPHFFPKSIKVYNIFGNVVLRQRFDLETAQTVDLSFSSGGVFIFEIIDDEQGVLWRGRVQKID